MAASSAGVRRVLMTADTVGGVWTYAIELSTALAARGVEVVLATMGEPLTRQQAREAARVPRLDVRESRYRLEWMPEPWSDVDAAGEWLLGLARELRPDRVHLNGFSQAALPWGATVVVVAHSCVLSWWEAVRRTPPPAEWERYRRRVRRGLRAADLVVAPSRAMAEEVERHYGQLDAVTVIANARRADLFPPLAKAHYVFAAGRLWDEAKNVEALARVAPELRWPVILAGPDVAPEVEAAKGRVAPPPNVRFLGRLDGVEVASWMGRASIYALPARYEPFGLSVLEAALAGCALVLGDVASLREQWRDAALFVPPDDGPALRDAINDLIAAPDRLEALAKKARKRALRQTPERMCERYLEAYALAAAPRRRAPFGGAPADATAEAPL